MDIKNSSYTPIFKKSKMPWENTLFMGIELELEHTDSYDANSDIDEFDNNFKRKINPFYYKTDCSLDEGVEFVTHPFTLQYAHKKIQFKRFLDYLKKETEFYPQKNVGLHVHLSKSFFTLHELRKIDAFFTANQKQLKRFSLRTYDEIDEWCPPNNFDFRDFVKGDKRPAKEKYIDYNSSHYKTKLYNRAYHSCSISSHLSATLEIRLFASTLKSERLTGILQFCDALAYFIKDTSIVAIAKKNSWNLFIDWCNSQNRYRHFLKEWSRILSK